MRKDSPKRSYNIRLSAVKIKITWDLFGIFKYTKK